MLLWVFAGVGSGRLHPVPVVYLLMVVLFQPTLVPHFVLHRQRIFAGDRDRARRRRRHSRRASPRRRARTRGRLRPMPPSHDALYIEPASQRLMNFTTGRQTPARAALSLEELLRDDMPPLEDLIVGRRIPGRSGRPARSR